MNTFLEKLAALVHGASLKELQLLKSMTELAISEKREAARKAREAAAKKPKGE